MRLELTDVEIAGLERVDVVGLKNLGDLIDVLPQSFIDKEGFTNTLHITRGVATGLDNEYDTGDDYWDVRYSGYHQVVHDNDDNLRSALVRLIIKLRKEGYMESVSRNY